MARFKPVHTGLKLLPVDFDRQIVPGSFEYALCHLVDHELDLTAFHARYKNDVNGASEFDPAVFIKVILLAYSRGTISSRKIEAACRENVLFMAVSGDSQPHFTTLAAFVSDMGDLVAQLFAQVLLICMRKEIFVYQTTSPTRVFKNMPSPPPSTSPTSPSPSAHIQKQEQPTENADQVSVPSTSTAQVFHARQLSASRRLSTELHAQVMKNQQAVSKRASSPTEPDPQAEPLIKRRRHNEETVQSASDAGQYVDAKPKLQWSTTTATVRKIMPEDFPSVLKTFGESFKEYLDRWCPNFVPLPANRQRDADALNLETAERTPEEIWHDRLQHTYDMIADLEEADYSDDTALAYCIDDKPIGLMVMSERAVPNVDALITHPDTQGVGGALIEQAVNMSERWGERGRLGLRPDNKNAQKAFEALGFILSGTVMMLDPAKSEKWSWNDELWRRRKYEDKKYFANLSE